MFEAPFNVWAVIVATVANMVIAWLWYGPLFGKKWMELTGVSPGSGRSMGTAMSLAVISSLLTAYFLARIIGEFGATSIGSAISIAFWIWLGFIVTWELNKVAFENRSMKLVFINTGAQLVWFLVAAIIFGVWV